MKAIVQKWEESERGWGTRPDGYSLHLTEVDRAEYVKAYYARMPAVAPDEYDRPSGTPYEADITDSATLELLQASESGIRRYSRDYPGSGGTDGWVPVARQSEAS